jgi:hypothetical protein
MVWFSSPDQSGYLQHIETDHEQQQEKIEKKRDVVVGSQQKQKQHDPHVLYAKVTR